MSSLQTGHFYSPSMGDITFERVIDEIFKYISEKPEMFYEIVVGCDSSSNDKVSFPIAIVIRRLGRGGRFFLKRIKYPESFKKRFSNWRQRILQEVLLSCELALFLRETLDRKTRNSPSSFNYQFQYIHADVGEQGQTRDMIKEIVGLIKSNGFEAKIKPDAFAATVVADRYT